MNNNYTIRPLLECDFESLNKLYYTFWNEESNINKMHDIYRRYCDNNNYIILCALENNIVVGSIMGIICYELYGECDPFLIMEDLVVDIKYRKKGIGKLLLRNLEEIGKEKGCKQIQFITEKNRQDSIIFYESLGYNSTKHIGFKKKL
ncbi:MAG: hypothetical protein A2355_07915 [Spirochaetes bacterium RIFOXYB1_FULL_32_8]|nr:MAG: hypothetical protein A2Y30_01355 [Spirochaetes bacterium GWE1_32_154]OHD82621.1 MAG: hypothetical protein A2355_07915 [Spirochaetes bacterium RIFOXYB1_FULL_32_8]